MRLAIERRATHPAADGSPALLEVVTPRTNAAIVTPAENLFAALALGARRAFSLEVAAGPSGERRFLARAGDALTRQHLADQLGAAYPQAALRPVEDGAAGAADPSRPGEGEQVAACRLALRGPAYLPLRTFRDADVAADRAAQADPVLGLLGALATLPPGWRALGQLVLVEPAADDWCRDYLRLAVEHPLASERATAGRGADTSLAPVFLLGGLMAAAAAALQAHQWFLARAWLPLGLLAVGLLAGLPALVWAVRRLRARPVYDIRLVQEKVGRPAFRAELRLAVFAPAETPRPAVEARLGAMAGAYRQLYSLASGNGLLARPLRLDHGGAGLDRLTPLGPAREAPVLNTRELAGLWHLPQADADVRLLERTTARRWLPRPESVAHGCPVGRSEHQGQAVPVALPDALVRDRHLLLVAKTRRGKSSLLLHLARYLMDVGKATTARSALVLVDPHRDLAEAALGLVPAHRRADVVYLDVGAADRPFGLNLLDVGLGWERDQAVGNVLAVFRRAFDRFWGPRMEDAFRFALLTLCEANAALCADDPERGPWQQHTLLDVPPVLTDPAFRRSVLRHVADPVVKAWWSGYFEPLDRRLQLEILNPVATKVNRFAGSRAARAIVGQPRSTIDPAAWLRDGRLVVVNAARGVVGEDTAALVGGTLLNLAALAIGAQAARPAAERRRVTLLVDEFHTMPGADYEAILSELAKYGANMVLATQSLAKLAALDRAHAQDGRALQATVFANVDGLFAFHTSAEDARYLVHELGGGLDEQDLVELGEHQCYARVSAGRERLPTFSIQLDPPPTGDAAVAANLATASAALYGRDAELVDADLRAALARVKVARGPLSAVPPPGAGVATESATGALPVTTATRAGPSPRSARSEHRNQGRPRRAPATPAGQATLFEPAADGPADAAVKEPEGSAGCSRAGEDGVEDAA